MPGSREYVNAWKRAHKQRIHEYYLKYREKYPERFPPAPPPMTPEQRKARAAERGRLWKKNNPDRVREIEKRSEHKHKVRRAEVASKWREANPDRIAASKAKSHAKRRYAKKFAGGFTAKEWRELLDRTGHRCACCGIPEEQSIYKFQAGGKSLTGKLTVDHIVPLSKGGSGYIENIAPLCLPCNVSKRTKTINYLQRVAIA